MEHFVPDEIERILREFHRVLKPSGKLLIFWPMRSAPSVNVLKVAHFFLNRLMRRSENLHPAEVSLLSSRQEADAFFNRGGFVIDRFLFGLRDLYTQAMIVASKGELPASS